MKPLPIDQSLVIAFQDVDTVDDITDGRCQYSYTGTSYRCVLGACTAFPEAFLGVQEPFLGLGDYVRQTLREATGLTNNQLRNLQTCHDTILNEGDRMSAKQRQALQDLLRSWCDGGDIPTEHQQVDGIIDLSLAFYTCGQLDGRS